MHLELTRNRHIEPRGEHCPKLTPSGSPAFDLLQIDSSTTYVTQLPLPHLCRILINLDKLIHQGPAITRFIFSSSQDRGIPRRIDSKIGCLVVING